jgi:hypothetical protein
MDARATSEPGRPLVLVRRERRRRLLADAFFDGVGMEEKQVGAERIAAKEA